MSINLEYDECKILKGLPIIFVVISHQKFVGCFDSIPIISDLKITSIFCEVGMYTFLFLSGYGIYESYVKNGFRDFFERKVLNIIIPASIVQFIYCWCMWKRNSSF